MVKYDYLFSNWVYVLECLYFMGWVMTFPVIIIFLVLLLWFVICLPLLELYYLESKLDKSYDMMILGVNMKGTLLLCFLFSCVIMLVVLITLEVIK